MIINIYNNNTSTLLCAVFPVKLSFSGVAINQKPVKKHIINSFGINDMLTNER